ncbi:MAG TPA: M28 family metallopeptidase [Solirubrobacterales bacterium]|nr:M28 family metallopeptidase [Solirubrobacterales bacterium]
MTSPPSRRSAPAPARGASASPRTSARLSALLASAALAAALAGCGGDDSSDEPQGADRFDAAAAFASIEDQVAVGQRPAGSPQLRKLAERLRAELPEGRFEPVPGHSGLRNVVGTLPGPGPAIVIAAHYDTEAHPPGFVGANDGAAGTAAVVELARVLERELPPGHREVRFVLFDGEEEPLGCPDAQFQRCALRGSKAYAAAHRGEIGELVLLDYIANEGLRLPREGNSDPALYERLRTAAREAGFAGIFAGDQGLTVIDDHIPFVLQGVPAIDLIDFDYRYADTVEDTPDKLSEQSLDAVGESVAELALALAAPQE